MAATRKTGTSAEPTATESVEQLFDEPAGDAVRDASEPSNATPAEAGEPATTAEVADQTPAAPATTPDAAAATPSTPLPPLSATQLLNDPLLGTHDEIIFDLGLKLRWAAVLYAGLGIVASWLLAAVVAIATHDAIAFVWALAATVLAAVGAVWYFADVSTRFSTVDAYRRAKTPQAIARLDRGAVVGLYGVVGTWVGIGLAALAVVAGVVTCVLTIAVGAAGWAWFFGAAPTVLLYLYGFLALHYRLLEKTRDAVA